MIAPKGPWTRFKDDHEKLEYMKEFGLLPPKATDLKQLVYTGAYANGFCTLVGYVDEFRTVIDIDGSLHCILPEYLKEMQTGFAALSMPERYVVLDIETTGFSLKTDAIIEIAAVKYQHGIQEDTFESLLFTDNILPLDIQSLTGITPDEVINAPSPEQIIPEFSDFIGSLPVVAHNAPFDFGFLKRDFKKHGLSLNNTIIDTLKLARKAYPSLASHSLQDLKKYLNIKFETAHRALPDVLSTAELYVKCSNQLLEDRISEDNVNTNESTPVSEPVARKPRNQNHTYQQVRPKDIVAASTRFDCEHPLYQKNVVFTGELKIDRKDAMQMAVDVGAVVKSAVSGKTHYLIVGKQDLSLVGSDGMSSKEEKAHALNQTGKADIKIIGEDVFLQLIHHGKEV